MSYRSEKSSETMWIPRRMHRSPAFRKLTATAILVYLEFKYRCKYAQAGSRGRWHHVNNGELIFTYADAKKKFNITPSTFARAIGQLVKFGFIEVTHHGGGMLKDSSKYAISERWQDYGKEEFIEKFRKKDERKLGFSKKNWENRTGRKRKTQSNIAITNDTRSSISLDSCRHKKHKPSTITSANLKTSPNYYIQKGLKVFEAMSLSRYH